MTEAFCAESRHHYNAMKSEKNQRKTRVLQQIISQMPRIFIYELILQWKMKKKKLKTKVHMSIKGCALLGKYSCTSIYPRIKILHWLLRLSEFTGNLNLDRGGLMLIFFGACWVQF